MHGSPINIVSKIENDTLFFIVSESPMALEYAIVGIKLVVSATLNDIGNITRVSTLPLNIPYWIFASFSLKKFFNPLTTVIESMLLFNDPSIEVSDIGIDTVNTSLIVLKILVYLYFFVLISSLAISFLIVL